MVWLSNSSFNEVANRGPPVVKSVVLWIVRSPIIVIRSEAVGVVGTLVPTTIVTEPVPSPEIDTV